MVHLKKLNLDSLTSITGASCIAFYCYGLFYFYRLLLLQEILNFMLGMGIVLLSIMGAITYIVFLTFMARGYIYIEIKGMVKKSLGGKS